MRDNLLKKLSYALHENRKFIKDGNEKNRAVDRRQKQCYLLGMIGSASLFVLGTFQDNGYLLLFLPLMLSLEAAIFLLTQFLTVIRKSNKYSVIYSGGYDNDYIRSTDVTTIFSNKSVYSFPDYERNAKNVMLSGELQGDMAAWLTENLDPAEAIRHNCEHKGKAKGILTRLSNGEIYDIKDLDLLSVLFTKTDPEPAITA